MTCYNVLLSYPFFCLMLWLRYPAMHAVNRVWRSVRHMTYLRERTCFWGRYETDPHLGIKCPKTQFWCRSFLCLAVWNIRTCMLTSVANKFDSLNLIPNIFCTVLKTLFVCGRNTHTTSPRWRTAATKIFLRIAISRGSTDHHARCIVMVTRVNLLTQATIIMMI